MRSVTGVCRRVAVPETITLGKLHDVIQATMGWCDRHLHEFEIAGERYGIPDPEFDWGDPVRAERRVILVTALSGTKTFRYTYDFGDGWEHRIKVEMLLPPDPASITPHCLAGANACPPEDVGGPSGYIDFVDAVSDPDKPEHAEMVEWWGGPFDPTIFDVESVIPSSAKSNPDRQGGRRRTVTNLGLWRQESARFCYL